MRVIVTGGAGFIGSAVCRYFIETLGYDVLVVDKLTYAGNLASLSPVAASPSFSFEQSDICDAHAMRTVFSKYRPDAVVHLAAESHVDRSISGPIAFVQTNVVGTFNLLETAREYLDSNRKLRDDFRFIHVSTDEVYGSLDQTGLFSETTPYDPSSPYSATKAALHSYTLSQRYKLKDSSVTVLEIVPPWVQTDLMGGDKANDPRAMPLKEFIDEAMKLLGTDAQEILVERVKPLRNNPGPNEGAFVTQFNDRLMLQPH